MYKFQVRDPSVRKRFLSYTGVLKFSFKPSSFLYYVQDSIIVDKLYQFYLKISFLNLLMKILHFVIVYFINIYSNFLFPLKLIL